MPPRKKTKRGSIEALAFAFPASRDGFPALPLDILFEIFSLVHPLDLINLTRTTKPFRLFLLNRANVGIWRATFAAVHAAGLPECPPYASELAWARLVFEKTCHICSTTLRVDADMDPVWWEFSARYCRDCMDSETTKTILPKLKRLDPKRNWKAALPSVPRNRYPGDPSCFFLKAHQNELINAYNNTEDAEARAAIIAKRVEDTRLITHHSNLWRVWTKKQIDKRKAEAENRQLQKRQAENAAKETRLQAIVAKLNAIGWSNEPWMAGGELARHIRWLPDVFVPKPLAPRAYRELEPRLLSQLTTDKRAHIVAGRLRKLQSAFPSIITSHELTSLALEIPPRRPDMALLSPVRLLMEDPTDAPVTAAQLVSALRPVMPGLLQKWVGDVMVQIGEHARKLLKLGDTADPLGMAIAYVPCPRNCGVAGHMSTLLKHSCTACNIPSGAGVLHWLHPQHTSFHFGSSEAYQAQAQSVLLDKCFTPSVLHFGRRLEALEAVVKVYDRDPKTTTVKEMEGDGRLVNCVTCIAKARAVRGSTTGLATKPMGWLAAMDHSLKVHLAPRDDSIEWKL
ncbi:hypothetical protein C8F04DRAFT_1062608 [Mycena alexandri]|uniref:F-box domain-containing protein n=1 Tax=Mycena alexandri TaxID=1745969 RepID=A0AAD6XGC9_9AGAR|nr:hypothetical protein C8F04DRAFT_1062608 [Mycena alexandri]